MVWHVAASVQLFMYTIRIGPEATLKNNDRGSNSNPLTRLDRIEYAAVIYRGGL